MKYKIILPVTLIFCSLSAFSDVQNAQTVMISAGSTANSVDANLPLLSESTNGGETWTTVASSALPQYGMFNGTSCTESICIAAGTQGQIASPLLVQSTDNGKKWDNVTLSSLPANSGFTAASCTGTGNTAVCVAVGQSNPVDPSLPQPLLVESMNGGQTWSPVTITTGTTIGFLSSVNCTGTGKTAICTVAGTDGSSMSSTSQEQPLLIQTINGGQNWSIVTPSNYPTNGALEETSCTGSGSTAICIAAGNDYSDGIPQPDNNTIPKPLLVESINGGQTWSNVVSNALPILGALGSTNCIGKGNKAFCVTTGYQMDLNNYYQPIILQSVDGGKTWERKTISNLPNSNEISLGETSCAETSDGTPTCVSASSYRLKEINRPLLIQSTDGGQTWSAIIPKMLSNLGYFNAASCMPNGKNVACTAVGTFAYSYSGGVALPLLMQTIDSGLHWTQITSGIPTTNGSYDATSI